ncbi:DNA-binding response regulator [candidate division KSB1 bacterium]|nr:MAG: DNA-binding response regulator [candidate division KSB1 bacterium]
MKILIIEDEKKVSDFIKKGLEYEGFIVEASYSGKDGINRCTDTSFDLIILDLMLPEIDGISILKTVRNAGIDTPVLILTAKGNIQDRINGLNTGADDYLVKPFAFEELLARVRALLRRSKKDKQTHLKFDDLSIDLITRKVTRGEKNIELTPKEYSLLEFFVMNKNRVINKITIAEHVWNYNFDRGTNFVEVYVNRLRNKLDADYDKKFIQTIRGYGYIFRTEKK